MYLNISLTYSGSSVRASRITFGDLEVFVLSSARHAIKSLLPMRSRRLFKIGYVFLVTVFK